MEDSEKLRALKKAYADIILNTAKEAAARVMVSERKATRFQQELVSTKEEALRMLLRLKQMLDSKVNVAEKMSLSQQKKIDELEAQLQEAEEIVRDLRAELSGMQAMLEKVTNNKMHSPDVQNIKGGIAAQENCLQENTLDPSDGSVYSVSDLHFDSVAVYDNRNSTVNETNDGRKFGVPHDHINNCYIQNPDFASIIIRRKEPELYRNGCTQRIRAFERNLLDGNMSLSGNVEDVQNENLVRVDEGKAVPVTTNPKADIICEMDKPDEVKVVSEVADHVKVPLHRKKARFRLGLRPRLHSDHVKETNKASQFSCTKGSPCVLDTNAPSRKKGKNSSRVCTNEVQKDPVSPSFPKVCTDSTTIVELSGSHDVRNETSVRVDEGKAVPVTTNPKADIVCEMDKPDEVKVVREIGDNVKASLRRKRARFGLRLHPRLHSDQVKESKKASQLSCRKGSSLVLDTNAPSRKKRKNSSIMVCANKAQKDPVSPFSKVSTDATAMVEQSGSHNVQNETLVRREEGKAVLVTTNPKADIICETDKPEELLDKSDLTRQRSLSTENVDVPACRADVEAANESSDKLDPKKVSYLDEKVSSRSANDKFLKYTFHRKRKKEAISVPDTNCSLETSSLKKNCGEKQNGYVEPQKSCTMTESTRDSRRLAQVARQLISLSEKKW